MIDTRTCFSILLAAGMMIASCSDDTPTKYVDPDPVISGVRVPAQMWTDSETEIIISATVSDAQGLDDIQSVSATILKPDSITVVFSASLNDSAARGDLIAFDGIYSREISTSFLDDSGGLYIFAFEALDTDGHSSGRVTRTVPVLLGAENEPPSISDISLPGIIGIDPSIEYTFTLTATDPQGLIDLAFVIFRAHRQDNPSVILQDTVYDDGITPDRTERDGLFTGLFTATFADSAVGTYPLSFQVFDLSGASTDYIRRNIAVINETNAPPYISQLAVPDTFDSRSATNFFIITLNVVDPQGLADVDSVHFTSFKPDSTWANHGNPIPLLDNGNFATYGDARAGDGIYSFRAIFDPTAQKGDYVWTFVAVDRSGLRSNIIVHILTVI